VLQGKLGMKPYRYLDTLSFSDEAFEAQSGSLDDLFRSAADALLELMIEDVSGLEPKARREVHLKRQAGSEHQGLGELLHDFLEKIVYWKDVDQLLLRAPKVLVSYTPSGRWVELSAELVGDQIDSDRHRLGTDVKAVTYHKLRVWEEGGLWKATVVVDV